MNAKELGHRLAVARRRAKMHQDELARKARVSASDISRWECGRSEPRLFSLMRIARALGVTLDQLAPVAPAAAKSRKSERECQVTTADSAFLTGAHGGGSDAQA